MASFNILSNADWDTYLDIEGGTVSDTTATLFRYVSISGLTVTLHGTQLTYDAHGIATGGTVTGLDVYGQDGTRLVHYAQYTGLDTSLVDFERLALGLTSGSATAADTDMETLYALMRMGDDTYSGSNLGRTALGYDGNDTLAGNGGDDWFVGGRGIDRYYGGDGVNGVSFFDGTATQGVVINFAKTTGNILNDGTGNVETATAVSMAEGTDFADSFTAGKIPVSFYGHGGDDTMMGERYNDVMDGGAGLDQFYGGGGIDTLQFSDATRRVVVDLSATTGPQILNDGFGNAESAQDFENVDGGAGSDSLTGTAAANSFSAWMAMTP